MIRQSIFIQLVLGIALKGVLVGQVLDLPNVVELPPSTSFSSYDKGTKASIFEAIGDAQVVLLGEGSHFDGSTLEAKVQWVKFLHEEMGFDVLISEVPFEGSIYGMREMLLGEDSLTGIYSDMNGQVSTFPASMRNLALYNAAKMKEGDTLFLAGMDVTSGHYGNDFGPDFQRFLDSCGRAIRADWAYQRIIKYLILRKDIAFDSEDEFGKYIHQDGIKEIKDAFYRLIRLCEEKLTTCQCANRFLHIPAMLRVKIGRLVHYEKNFRPVSEKKPVNAAFTAERDRFMAQNAIWLIDTLYAGHKVIVSASSFHTSRNLSDYPNPQLPKGQKTMGDYLYERYSPSLHSICFVSYGGITGLASHWVDTLDTGLVPEFSLESTLHTRGNRYAYVDFDLNNLDGVPFYMNPTLGYSKIPWQNCFDAACFVDEMFPRTEIVYWDRIKKRIDPKGKYPGSWK